VLESNIAVVAQNCPELEPVIVYQPWQRLLVPHTATVDHATHHIMAAMLAQSDEPRALEAGGR